MTRIAAVALVLVVVAGGSLWLRRPPAVVTAVATRGDLTDAVSATGVVEARSVVIASMVPGRVASVAVREGDAVRAGQTMLVLQSRELAAQADQAHAAVEAARQAYAQSQALLDAERAELAGRIRQADAVLAAARAQRDKVRAGAMAAEIKAAEADVARAGAAVDEASRATARVRDLVRDGAVGQAQLDSAVGAERALRASLEAAQARLTLVREGARKEDLLAADAAVAQAEALAQAARDGLRRLAARAAQMRAAAAQVRQADGALRVARAQLDAARISAPLNGTVVRLAVEVGQVAAAGSPLLELADLSDRWVSVAAESDDLARFEAAGDLTITSESYPGRAFPGHVRAISSVATPTGRGKEWMVRVKITVTDPDHLLRPGMEVDVDGRVILARDTFHTAKEAVLEENDRAFVFAWDGTAARRTEVTLGPASLAEVALVSGLREGDLIVTSGLEHLRRGHRVRMLGRTR